MLPLNLRAFRRSRMLKAAKDDLRTGRRGLGDLALGQSETGRLLC